MSSPIDALAIVVNYITLEELQLLRSKNAKLEKAYKSLRSDLKQREEYYFNLVSLARTRDDDPPIRLTRIKRGLGVENYDKELSKLEGEEGDWNHGFNSGMLAATRLYGGLGEYEDDTFENESGDEEVYPVEKKWEDAKEDFPFLDS